MGITDSTDETFESDLRAADGPVLADFWASWCPPCKMMEPVLRRLADTTEGRATLLAVNVDRNPLTARKYQISNVPTFVVFRSAQEVARRCGAQTESGLRRLLESTAPSEAA